MSPECSPGSHGSVLPAMVRGSLMCNSRKIPVFIHIPWPVVLATLVLFLSCGDSTNAADADHHLTVLHTNDLLGRLLPEPYLGQPDWGGFARLAHVIEQERGARHDSVLILDGGDALGDSPIAAVDAGRLVVHLMNRMGYDAMVLGNHEFDYGIDSLYARRDEATFHLLGANLGVNSDRPPLTAPYVLMERAGLKVAVIGLVSPGATKSINRLHNPALGIGDPRAALQNLLKGPAGQADLQIVLVHMNAREAGDLALDFPEVDLWIAGSLARVTPKGTFQHVVRIGGGGYLVTTPGRGVKLGRIDLRLRRDWSGIELVDVRPTLVPVGPLVLKDRHVSFLIDRQHEILKNALRENVGRVNGPIVDAPQWVADLIRTRLNVEISIINHGTLRELNLDGDIQLGTLFQLVRYDDILVRVEVTGRQLRAMAESSARRTRQGEKLVFSGFDPESGRVGGRMLSRKERYQVATTGFLASGGDDYLRFKGFPEPISGREITLLRLLEEHLRAHPAVGRWDGARQVGRGVWKNRTSLNGSLSRTTVDASANRYSGVSFLGGDDAMAWNGQLESRNSYESRRGTLAALLRTGFGQVVTRDRRRDAVDRVEVEALYTLAGRRPAPFLGFDVNTVWTSGQGESHPVTLRMKGGVYRSLGPDAGVRVGLAVERDFVEADYVAGLEVAPKYRAQLRPGNVLASETKFFWGASQRSALSLQNFNSLQIRLVGNLAATLDANLFIHRDSNVQALAVKSEIHFGLGYSWRKKWF